jgi:hypothetical protein
MCWSGEASAVLASVGFASTAYAVYKKEPFSLWVALGYFSLMEILQAYTYTVIDKCTLPGNQIATLLGYLHIAFQPFFINAVSLYFIPKNVADRIHRPVYTLCFVCTIFLIIQLYPMQSVGTCEVGSVWLCAKNLCSVSGNWHIAWDIPLNGIGNWFHDHHMGYWFAYILPGFIVPVLYGSWRFTLYHFLLGPMLAMLLTNNLNEIPAVWCLLSIGLLLIVVKTPIRKILFVRSWPLWPKQTSPSLQATKE